MKTKQFLVIFGWLVVGCFYPLFSQNPKTSQVESALKLTSVEISKPLALGWTWFSLNVQGADMSLGTVLNSLGAQDGDYIKNQTVSSTYYAGTGWFGELTLIDPKEMYKIKLSHAANLLFSGDPVDIVTHPITINSGWNWIGYLPQSAKTVAEALSTLGPAPDDYIKNQTQSSTFYDGAGWFGELLNLVPSDGYMLKTNHTGTLTYIEPTSGTITDARDGNTYPWIKIGTQNWMAKNLAWLPSVSPSASGSEVSAYYYVFGYQGTDLVAAKAAENYTIRGVLYNWVAAKTGCPAGWHLPTDDEWKILEKYLGMSNSDANATGRRNSGLVGGKLKETGTTHWASPNTGANNSSGFTAISGGNRYTDGKFYMLTNNGHFWSSSGDGGSYAWSRSLYTSSEGVDRFSYNTSIGFSVRCLRN